MMATSTRMNPMTKSEARTLLSDVAAGKEVSLPRYVDALRLCLSLGYRSVSAFLRVRASAIPVIANQCAHWCGNP